MKKYTLPKLLDFCGDPNIEPASDVILFGMSHYTRLAICSLKQRRISPVGIIDPSPTGAFADLRLPQLTLNEARNSYPNATLVVSTLPEEIDSGIAELQEAGWKHIQDCTKLFTSFSYAIESLPYNESWLQYLLDQYFYKRYLRIQRDFLIVPSLDIVITERCSMKCQDCSNLMQYYTDPRDIEFNSFLESLDSLMRCIDHVFELRLIGGEPFMNKQAHEYVSKLQQFGNCSRIAVYTNGTIVPPDERLRCFAHENTYVRISNYGNQSKKLGKLAEAMGRLGVQYQVDTFSGWQDCAKISDHNRSRMELEKTFASCCAKELLTFLKGNVYQCPFAANAYNLEALPLAAHDSIEVTGADSPTELRGQLFEMLRERKSTEACKYCAGRENNVNPLPVAVQTSSPLHYVKLGSGRDDG